MRLVAYSGAPRIPFPIFNEKVLAGLGADLAKTGKLSAESQEGALAALGRYRLLIDHMGVKQVRAVATAAARDAAADALVKQSAALALNAKCSVPRKKRPSPAKA